jgi:ParB family chromosome partitioning protein
MLWNVSEVGERRSGEGVGRVLAVAGAMQRRSRAVLTLVPVAAVRPNPDQPRKHFAEDKLAELAASIRLRGLLQPIVVRRAEGGFELLAGERRFRAAQMAGLERLPALVREGEDPLEIALIENLQREDLSPLEEAEALAALIERHGYSHQEVADILGRSRPYVSNTLALTRLPEQVKEDIHRGGHVSVSRELLLGVARQGDVAAAVSLWERFKGGVPSVREFRAGKRTAAPETPLGREVLLAARRLNQVLRRLIAEGAVPAAEAAAIGGTLKRTQELVRRELAILRTTPAPPAGL